jgi:hypothetical protein
MSATNIHDIVSNAHAERDGKSGQDLRMADGSLWFHPYSGGAPIMIEQSDAHNPDTNPNWTPKMGYRVYACCDCGTETTVQTNHRGLCHSACAGSCRDIFNPHTARETVQWHPLRPHRYVREAYQ